MAKVCEITGKKTTFGNRSSHANNKTRRSFTPNLQGKRLYLPELGTSLYLRVSTAALRTIHKDGLLPTLKKAYKKDTLSPRLRGLAEVL